MNITRSVRIGSGTADARSISSEQHRLTSFPATASRTNLPCRGVSSTQPWEPVGQGLQGGRSPEKMSVTCSKCSF